MPLIDLSRINYSGLTRNSSFYVSAVVESEAGPETVTLVSNELDLDRYFPGLENREGYVKLIKAGATLALKRFKAEGSRHASLRLTTNPSLKYVYPEKYDEIVLDPDAEKLIDLGIILITVENEEFNITSTFYEMVELKGSAIGNFSSGDGVSIQINGNFYYTNIDSEGDFSVEVRGADIVNSEDREIITTISSVVNGSTLVRTNYFNFFHEGDKKLYLEVEDLPVIRSRDITANSYAYSISGTVSGDTLQNDLVTCLVNGQTYSTRMTTRGKFTFYIALADILNDTKVEIKTFTVRGNNVYSTRAIKEYEIDKVNLDLSSRPEFLTSYIDIQDSHEKTLVYEIDFGNSEILPEDYVIIPRANLNNWNSNVMFYFIPEDDSTLTPNDFVNPVSLESVSSPQYSFIIPNDPVQKEALRKRRAEEVYNVFMGSIFGGDSGVIKELCVLDKINNKVKLVFQSPVTNLIYFQSNDTVNPFKVTTNIWESLKLLTRDSREEAVLSFRSKIQGDVEIELVFEYVEGFKFYVTETRGDDVAKYYVSLNPYDLDTVGESMYIEDIINRDSINLECKFHKSTEVIAYLEGENTNLFIPANASSFAGTYKVSYGSAGERTSDDIEIYEECVKDLLEGDIFMNLFFTDKFNTRDYINKLLPYLKSSTTIGFTNIPDYVLPNREETKWLNSRGEVLNQSQVTNTSTGTPLKNVNLYTKRRIVRSTTTEEDILKGIQEKLDVFLVDSVDREYLIYCFGEASLGNGVSVPVAFYQMRELIAGNFIGPLEENILCTALTPSEAKLMEDNYINYLEETEEGYNITYLVNVPNYLDPIYLASAVYVKQFLSNFLRAQIANYYIDIYFQVKQEVALVKSYTDLIKEVKIKKFTSKSNTLTAIFEVELTGLIGKNISINITLNLN